MKSKGFKPFGPPFPAVPGKGVGTTTYVQLVAIGPEDSQHPVRKIIANALRHAVAQVVFLDLEDSHEAQVSERRRDFSAQLVPVQPHLLHQPQVSEGFRDRSRESTLGDREGLEGRQASQKRGNCPAQSRVAIDPVLEDDGHGLHVGQIARDHGVGGEQVFEAGQPSDLRRNRAVELDAVHQQESQRGQVFKGGPREITGDHAVGDVQLH